VATDPQGRVHVRKVLARAGSEVAALAQLVGGEPLASLRVGTTVATNAVLTRGGAKTALLVTAGFEDLLLIGHQDRPDLFALTPRRPPPRVEWTVGVVERVHGDGVVEQEPDEAAVRAALARLRAGGAEALAVCLLHGHRFAEHERRIGRWAEQAGWPQISLSHEVAPEIGYVARAETTLLHARLTPVVTAYTAGIEGALPGVPIRFMKSSGGLTAAGSLGGTDAVLSGPAGGVVACAAVARSLGLPAVLGFDMGGTSTDVCRWAGELPRTAEIAVDDVRIRVAGLDVVTVAAGGGSVLGSRDGRLTVGPASAGADPGPACYGRGGPAAITDANVVLGRVQPDRFPAVFGVGGQAPLDASASAAAIAAAAPGDVRAAAAGFVAVADAAMAAAVHRLSSERGHDPAQHALIAFGGAAGQHACGVAARLGATRVVVPAAGSVLSAWGIAHAGLRADRSAPVAEPWDPGLPGRQAALIEALTASARAEVGEEGAATSVTWDLRYAGSTTALAAVDRGAFEDAHRRLFGFARPEAAVEATQVRVEARVDPPAPARSLVPDLGEPVEGVERRTVGFVDARGGWADESAQIVSRGQITPGAWVSGPALVIDDTTTAAVDPGWRARGLADGGLLLERVGEGAAHAPAHAGAALALSFRRFMSIAERVGETLRRVAWSVNIKERHDFSCAVFDAAGQLVANAPHIPVHLGAMGETVRALLEDPDVTLHPGGAWACNDPFAGGSHLPDITVMSPVFLGGRLIAVVASRGHHADVGGISPGSMPPFSTSLADEGVVFQNLPLVPDGDFDEAAVRAVLASGPHPCRDPDGCVADLQAQVAAGRLGEGLLVDAAESVGPDALGAEMAAVLDHGEEVARRWVAGLPAEPLRFVDALDDGTAIAAALVRRGDRLVVDFDGTGPASAGNLNAPTAVTRAALLYVLRLAVGYDMPLNEGCLRSVDLRIPPGCILDPPPGAAVVGGNVETSQRVVDVLLGALGLAAASQGTMNNLSFGSKTWGAYETLAGGHGATAQGRGSSAMHSHMTNTRITDAEVLEARLPVRVRRFGLRAGSGGAGAHEGGDGLVRELEFLEPVQVSLLAQRRTRRPFGLRGGDPAEPGGAFRVGPEGVDPMPPCFSEPFAAGERLRILTPGGGGFGDPQGKDPLGCGGDVESH